MDCGAGQYAEAAGSADCVDCAPGKYSDRFVADRGAAEQAGIALGGAVISTENDSSDSQISL
jgi:hypothetical protein